jgi:UDP-N-acetylglucosamine--N-acetylmuramyl-(pentapeptide) pyrophosphoryl-undecaprenol N-acetylglucosamine transferase
MNAVVRPVLIMAGGTGGHIFPGIAVAQELRARNVPVLWLGSAGGLETRLVPQAGFPIETLAIGGVRGKGMLTLVTAPLRILRAVIAAWRLLRRLRPGSALALGGFASGPGGIAAWLRGVPLIVHEQNAVPGVTNRILARIARKVLCGFSGTFAGAQWTGNPVRREIAAAPAPDARAAAGGARFRLLVLGGSQGARGLNLAMPQVLRGMDAGNRPLVRHQCGPGHLEKTRRGYSDAGVEAQVDAFIDDMAAAYTWADLVVCRAGALTIAELCAVGVAAILVPFPAAVDDHQTYNAAALVAGGAARLVAEGEVFAERLAAALTELLGDGAAKRRARLLAMASAARAMARPEAAARIADACVEAAA